MLCLYSCQNKQDAPSQNPSIDTYVTLDSTMVGISTVAAGLDVPWEITWGPDDWIWITEQKGVVKRLNPRTGEKVTMLELDDVYLRTTPGLLGMDIHPNQGASPYVFLLYNSMDEDEAIVLNLVRYTVDGDSLVKPTLLLEIPGGKGHNGSRLAISPEDKVIVATGEAGHAANAQDIHSLGGKILRLNIDGSIPEDNPFPGSPVWSWGYRNQQGLTFGNNSRLYTSEHGQATDDEINLIEKGRNYGWPHVEGKCDGPEEREVCADSSVAEPLKTWTPTIAPAGLAYYGSDHIPEWENSLILATLKNATLHVLSLNDKGTAIRGERTLMEKIFGRLRDVCISPAGDVYVSTSNHDWKPQENFPVPEDDRILRLSKITNEEELSGVVSVREMVSDSLKSFSATLSKGALAYQKYCASCHMPGGGGLSGTFPSLEETPVISGDKKALISMVLEGVSGEGGDYREAMPAFSFLSNKEIAELLTYIRSHFGNNATGIRPEEVENLRDNRSTGK
ncbi:PQQ-dependent sugar dehydrogenase [Fodinibius sediminis]|nr:PQQ-dependent sugar dehydrogenase [Fodinibius sediminis]